MPTQPPTALAQTDATPSTATIDWTAAVADAGGSPVSAHLTITPDRNLSGYSGGFDWQYRLNFAAPDFLASGVRYGTVTRGVTSGPIQSEPLAASTIIHTVGTHTAFGTTPPTISTPRIQVYRYPDPSGAGWNVAPHDAQATFNPTTFPPSGSGQGYWGWSDPAHGRWFFGTRVWTEAGLTGDEPLGDGLNPVAAPDTTPTGYQYRLDGGASTAIGLVTSLALDSLAPGTTYTFEIRTVSPSGFSSWVALEVTTTDPQPPAPGIASQAVLSHVGLDPAPDGANAPAQQWWDIDAADVATYSAVRSEGLFSYAIGYASRDPLGKPQPLSVGVVLVVPIGDSIAIGARFALRLSESLADALGLTDDAAIRATCIVTDVESDPSRTWTMPGYGTVTLYNVAATGWLSRYGAERIDGTGWPTEPVGARIGRILDSLGLAGDVDATGADVLPPQLAGTHHAALAPAADSTTGRVVEQRDGTVDYNAPDDRRGTLPALTLDASEILGNAFSWRQSVGDVVNDAEVTYGAGAKVAVRDPASADPRSGVGPYPVQISTALADELDAYALAGDIVGRRAWPYYQLPAVAIDLARSGLDTTRLADAFELVNGARVALNSMPDGSPWESLPRGCFVEGYTETATAYAWRLSLVVSDPALSGVSLRYIDVTPGISYDDVAAGISYLDVARIEDPADLL